MVLRHRLRELAGQRKQFASPKLHIMLKPEKTSGKSQTYRKDIPGRRVSTTTETTKRGCRSQSFDAAVAVAKAIDFSKVLSDALRRKSLIQGFIDILPIRLTAT